MSTSKLNSFSNAKHLRVRTQLGDNIRQKVGDRHWQLFETRLKNSSINFSKENYTKSNDYGVIGAWKKSYQFQAPMEPNQHWERFCSKITMKSNETNRLMSIFHNVWINDWNRRQHEQKSNLNSNENTFLKNLSANEHDKKVISSILRQNI